MKIFLRKNKYRIMLVFVILLSILLRFYKLGQVPPSLNWDEVSMGYNAYSILKTERDEYGVTMPLFFRSFDTYNPALSVYTLVPSVAFLGLTEFAVRFPSATFGILTVLLTYLLAKKLFKNEATAILAAFFLSISPWHLQFSRYHYEGNLMIFLTTLGLVLFLNSFKNYKLLILSFLVFGLSIYTSHGAKLWTALFLAAILFWYKSKIIHFKKKLIIPIVIILAFYLPIAFNFEKAFTRPASVSILNSNKPFDTLVQGYLSHFSFNFLFTQGDLDPKHSVGGMGELYVFEVPLILLGLIALLKAKNINSKFIITWLLLAPIPAAFSIPTPHAARSISLLPALPILTAIGFFTIIKTKFIKNLKPIIILILFLFFIYNVATYLHLYYIHYPRERALDWQDGYKEMVLYVTKIKPNYDRIAVTSYYGQPYIFILFYSKYDPRLYQQSGSKKSFDKFVFFGGSWEQSVLGKTLVVTTPAHGKNPPLKIIKAYNEPVFRIWDTN